MTWKELAAAIAKLPADEQDQPANVFDDNTAEQMVVEDLVLTVGLCESDRPMHKYTLML